MAFWPLHAVLGTGYAPEIAIISWLQLETERYRPIANVATAKPRHQVRELFNAQHLDILERSDILYLFETVEEDSAGFIHLLIAASAFSCGKKRSALVSSVSLSSIIFIE